MPFRAKKPRATPCYIIPCCSILAKSRREIEKPACLLRLTSLPLIGHQQQYHAARQHKPKHINAKTVRIKHTVHNTKQNTQQTRYETLKTHTARITTKYTTCQNRTHGVQHEKQLGFSEHNEHMIGSKKNATIAYYLLLLIHLLIQQKKEE